jgi:hypothetical protein
MSEAPQPNALVVHSQDPLWDTAAFAQGWRIAKMFAASALVPKTFQGKPEDCMIGILLARRLGEEPLTVLQSLSVIGGRPFWASKYMLARANRSGAFRGPITWTVAKRPEVLKFEREAWGDKRGEKVKTAATMPDLTVTARATLLGGEVVEYSVDSSMAIADGWANNPKYTSIPELMLRYRSASGLINLYAPEVMLGLSSADEADEIEATVVVPRKRATAERQAPALAALGLGSAVDEEPGDAKPPTVGDLLDEIEELEGKLPAAAVATIRSVSRPPPADEATAETLAPYLAALRARLEHQA